MVSIHSSFDQICVESMWGMLGMLDPGQVLQKESSGSDSTSDTTTSSVDTPSPKAAISPPVERLSSEPDGKERY